MNEGHAVAYNGGDKDNVQKQHLTNRQRLIDEGKVPTLKVCLKLKVRSMNSRQLSRH